MFGAINIPCKIMHATFCRENQKFFIPFILSHFCQFCLLFYGFSVSMTKNMNLNKNEKGKTPRYPHTCDCEDAISCILQLFWIPHAGTPSYEGFGQKKSIRRQSATRFPIGRMARRRTHWAPPHHRPLLPPLRFPFGPRPSPRRKPLILPPQPRSRERKKIIDSFIPP